MSNSQTLSIASEVAANPDDLTAGDVGVISTILADLDPNELKNSTVGLHVVSINTLFSVYAHCLLSVLLDARNGARHRRQSSTS